MTKRRKEIRILTTCEELIEAIERRALVENRTLSNLVETILMKELKVKIKKEK
jgi:hypothetical protein